MTEAQATQLIAHLVEVVYWLKVIGITAALAFFLK